jgi:O-antigen/teichoic acid export membrane protein
MFPTGLLTTGFLTRHLGASDYGIYTLAAITVTWIEWCGTSAFSRVTIKLVGESGDWRPAGASMLRLHLFLGSVLAVAMVFAAPWVAALLHSPPLVTPLRFFALDIPIFFLAAVHRNILVAVGKFRERALGSCGRWVGRLIAIVLLVWGGLSINGAVLGSVFASVAELAICRLFIRPQLFNITGLPMRRLWETALPLFLFATSLKIYERLDVMSLKALGASAARVGVYGAAQNVAIVPATFAVAFSPMVLGNATRMIKAGDWEKAREAGRLAMRVMIWFLPLAGVIAGSSTDIARTCFGPRFAAAGPIMGLLFLGSSAGAMISVAASLLIASGRSNLTLAIAAPMVVLALIGYRWLIPQDGAIGAAGVCAGCQILAASAFVFGVKAVLRTAPPLATLVRCAVAGVATFTLGSLWRAPGILLLVKLAALLLVAAALLYAMGEAGDIIKRLQIAVGRGRVAAAPLPSEA